MRIEFMKPQLSVNRLSRRAQEYFGGDVRSFVITKSGRCVYQIWQQPHYGNPRLAFEEFAINAREFSKRANSWAVSNDARYA